VDNKPRVRFLIYAFAIGVAGVLFALGWYIPTSGLIEALRPFTGLRLIANCTELYFGCLLIVVAYVFRQRFNVVVIYLAVAAFCITDAVEGIFRLATSAALQREFNWAYLAIDALGVAMFLIAVVVAFSTLRSD
jgi:uncharacterized membrane protein HdeD (DUF308 family)